MDCTPSGGQLSGDLLDSLSGEKVVKGAIPTPLRSQAIVIAAEGLLLEQDLVDVDILVDDLVGLGKAR
jgi:hypothetical protein